MPEFDHAEPVTVAVDIHGGRVEIHAEERTTVVADVVPLDGGDASRRAAEQTTVTLNGGALAVRAPDQHGWSMRRSGRIGVTVRVPSDSTIAARTASGDLVATGRFAEAQVKLASGDARIDQVTGNAHLEAASGDLVVGHVGGALRIVSSSGDLTVDDVTGDVSAETASGDIDIRAAGASVQASTASGDIEIGVVRQGESRLKTASGDVTVGVAAGTGVWLDVNTASGRTTSDLTMTADTPPTGAGLELRIRTASGDVTIRRVPATTRAAA